MADKTGIEWTDATWNPLAGCSIVSKGCTNCYAMKQAGRIIAMAHPERGTHYAGTVQASKAGPVWTGKIMVAPEHILTQPLRWKKPRRIFVNSMSDLFHEGVSDETIDRIFAVMALSRQHTFQVLTKRPERMKAFLANPRRPYQIARRVVDLVIADPVNYGALMGKAWWPVASEGDPEQPDDITLRTWPLPNVWLGTSVEDQAAADGRIPHLLATPAAIRFISAEPLLGPVDLTRICLVPQKEGSIRAGIHLNALAGKYCQSGQPYIGDWDVDGPCPTDLTPIALDWIIVGGESGPKARVWAGFEDAARDLMHQCRAAGVSFFMKQMAGGRKASMPPIPEDLMVREFPDAA